MSERYKIIAAMLDDPQNLAIVMREIHRRQNLILVSPPVRVTEGPATWAFFDIDSYVTTDKPHALTTGIIAEIRQVKGKAWEAEIRTDSSPGLLGPFGSDQEAIEETLLFLSGCEDHVLLKDRPWDRDDVQEFRLPAPPLPPSSLDPEEFPF